MLLTEWNLDDATRIGREEEWYEGWKDGWKEGREEIIKKMAEDKTPAAIASILKEPVEDIDRILKKEASNW